MRCGVVVEEEGNKFFVGRRFVYFGEAELHEIWQEPLSSATLPPFKSDKTRIQWCAGPFSEKEVYCSEVGEQEK
jgi:hypothetical protein